MDHCYIEEKSGETEWSIGGVAVLICVLGFQMPTGMCNEFVFSLRIYDQQLDSNS
jgi:hypothetical protein